MFAPLPFHGHEGVMKFLDVHVQQVFRGEVLPALNAAVRVGLEIVVLVLSIRREGQPLLMGRHRALHDRQIVFA